MPVGERVDYVLWALRTERAQLRELHRYLPRMKVQRAVILDGEIANGYTQYEGQKSGNVEDRGAEQRLCLWPRGAAGHEDPKHPMSQK